MKILKKKFINIINTNMRDYVYEKQRRNKPKF